MIVYINTFHELSKEMQKETREQESGRYEYKALYKSEQLVFGDLYCRAIVVTGWSAKERIAAKLPEGCFSACGQLYSPGSGLSILLRNLAYNPQIDTVVFTPPNAQDNNAGSIAALVAFFHHGVEEGFSSAERPCWKTIGARGEIDKEISIEALEELRGRIKVKTLPEYLASLPPRLSDVSKYTELTRGKLKSELGDRKVFPLAETSGKRLPGAYIGHKIEAATISEAFPEILYRIRTTGRMRSTGYGGHWQELIDLMVVIKDEPIGFKFELYLPVDREYIKNYIPQMCEGLEGKELGVKYTYGSRMREYFGHDQVVEIIDKLIAEPDSCSAVINLWDAGGLRPDKSSDHKHGGSPCLNHIWFRIYDDRLILTATFRSNDMYSAWVANAMGLRALQQSIVETLNDEGFPDLRMGEMITISQSAHIYDHAFEQADSLASKRNIKPNYSDDCGNFLVCWDALTGQVYVAQEYPQGIAAKEFRSSNPLRLIREICNSSPAIRPDHAGYLALEIQKCIEQKERYRQDN